MFVTKLFTDVFFEYSSKENANLICNVGREKHTKTTGDSSYISLPSRYIFHCHITLGFLYFVILLVKASHLCISANVMPSTEK